MPNSTYGSAVRPTPDNHDDFNPPGEVWQRDNTAKSPNAMSPAKALVGASSRDHAKACESLAGSVDSRSNFAIAEASMQASERRYNLIFHIAAVGIIHATENGRLLSANNFFCELLGYSQIELADMNIFALIDPQDIGALRNRFRQCYGNGERSSAITTRFHHKNGRKVWCEVTAATEWSAHGEERQVLLIISDSTAQKASELAQLELASYLRRAQRAEGIGQRAGEMVHDFNNLLFVILENLELLERKLAPEGDGLNLTRRTIRAAQHGAELARTVLEFGRENTCTPKVTGPANILVAISGMLRQSLRDDIRLDIKLADHLWPVLIDAAQLESAILNLAFNARDAMPSGGTLTIEARNVIIGPSDELGAKSTLGDYLAISLSDTGTGIAPEVIAKIFDPFFTTKGTNGSGLGLSIVRTFVEASGGFVKIVSELGEGTTITLYLPSA